MNIIDVTDLGAKSDDPDSGITNRNAFQAAIDAASLGPKGGMVYVPQGSYYIATPIYPDPNDPDKMIEQPNALELKVNVRLQGAGRNTQLVAQSSTSDLIRVSGARTCIEQLQFTTLLASQTAGAYIRNWSTPNANDRGESLVISDCWFTGGYDAIVCDYTGDLRIFNCEIGEFHHVGILLGWSARIENVYLTALVIGSTKPDALCGIYLRNTGGLFVSQVDIFGASVEKLVMKYGIYIDPATTEFVKWTFLNQVQCDSCLIDGLSANCAGNVEGLVVSNSWFATNGQQGLNIGWAGQVTGVTLAGCVFANNGFAGINLNDNCRQVSITGGIVSGNSTTKLFKWPGISVGIGVRDLLITGTVIGPSMGFKDSHSFGIDFQTFSRAQGVRCALTGNSLSNNRRGSNISFGTNPQLPSGLWAWFFTEVSASTNI